ncbi:MAG: hypothetical protein AB2L24_09535 [Mangrovibacterium sp.]
MKTIFKYLLPALLLSTACSDQLEIWDENAANTASIGFYGVSETFPYYNTEIAAIAIFADTTEYKADIHWTAAKKIPAFTFLKSPLKEYWFPNNFVDGRNNQPLYLNYAAGVHRFYFSVFGYPDINEKMRVAEAEFDFDAGSRTTLYFTDDAADEGAPAAYRVVKVPNYRRESVTAGKVSVRFIHLGMDAGAVSVRLLRNDDSESAGNLPQQLSFAQASDYVPADTAGVVQDGVLLFRVYPAGSNLPLVVGVPAQVGHSFDILLHGFTLPHTRQVVQENGPAYKTVELPVSFTATVRQMY